MRILRRQGGLESIDDTVYSIDNNLRNLFLLWRTSAFQPGHFLWSSSFSQSFGNAILSDSIPGRLLAMRSTLSPYFDSIRTLVKWLYPPLYVNTGTITPNWNNRMRLINESDTHQILRRDQMLWASHSTFFETFIELIEDKEIMS